MEPNVAGNEWGSILHHDAEGILELRWRRGGPPMTDAAFMATLCQLATVAERLQPPSILVDAAHFSHDFGEGVMEWREAAVLPRYSSAGVRKFAFILPADSPHVGEEATDRWALFPTAWFGSREDAVGWLTRDG